MTTSFCVDMLRTDKDPEEIAPKKRRKVHIVMSIILIAFICLFRIVNDKSVIDAIYIIASYTYGPLLGMFCFGLFTRRTTKDKWVPYIATTSPLICFALNRLTSVYFQYTFGYELLMLNGALTFAGMYACSRRCSTDCPRQSAANNKLYHPRESA
jgi:Na+/proline symporter